MFRFKGSCMMHCFRGALTRTAEAAKQEEHCFAGAGQPCSIDCFSPVHTLRCMQCSQPTKLCQACKGSRRLYLHLSQLQQVRACTLHHIAALLT